MRATNLFFVMPIRCFLVLACMVGAVQAAQEMHWQAPTTNEDGTSLTDLAGFKVYYGQTSRGSATHPTEFSYDFMIAVAAEQTNQLFSALPC